MDLISCVITTYKRPVTILKRAVDSVINQTYKNIELIVVNDAPQDHGLREKIRNLLNSYKTISVTYLVHQKNMGACQARNTAIEEAKGKYIAFLDDDDEWLPEKIEKQYAMIRGTSIALVYCSHYEISKNKSPVLVREDLARTGLHDDEFDRLLRANFIGSTSYPLLSLEAVKIVGGFNVELKASQDYDLWLRIAKNYSIVYLDEPLVNYYCSDVSISTNTDNVKQGIQYLLDTYENYYRAHRETYNYRLNYIAYVWLKRKEYKESLDYIRRALKISPLSSHNLLIFLKVKNKLFQKITRVCKSTVEE